MTTLPAPLSRSTLVCLLLLVLSALAACAGPRSAGDSSPTIDVPRTPLPSEVLVPEASLTLGAYKANVARHIMGRNPEHVFEGQLPPMLPAIVVLNITVDRDGRLTEVQVQRSRDPGASQVALASLRRSGPLPRPDGLVARHADLTTFSETFLFGERYRFQLRTLAGPQSSGL